jgi:hypothetical protein
MDAGAPGSNRLTFKVRLASGALTVGAFVKTPSPIVV